MNIAERFSKFIDKISTQPATLVAVITCVVVFTVLYYFMLSFLFKNGAHEIVFIFVVALIIGGAVISFSEEINCAIFLIIPALFLILIFILYSVEIKRAVWDHKNMKLVEGRKTSGETFDEDKIKTCIAEIIKALQNMSKNDIGALIVLSTGNIPSQILDSGVKIDSDISSELIESVFFPKTPLHDGAMIINGTRVVSAGCFLPLTQNIDNIPKELGTRHRAGIGVTETIDVISLIVSEETGIISIARGGKITRYANAEMLKNILSKYYWEEL